MGIRVACCVFGPAGRLPRGRFSPDHLDAAPTHARVGGVRVPIIEGLAT
jgi:hypothetical protein